MSSVRNLVLGASTLVVATAQDSLPKVTCKVALGWNSLTS